MFQYAYDIGIGLLAGVVSGWVSSLLVVRYISRIKPELEISEFIAKSEHGGVIFYDFKFINRSSRTAINIRSELVEVQPNEYRKGPLQYIKKIEMHQSDIFNIEPFDTDDKKAEYAGRVSTKANLDEILAIGNSTLRLSIAATDSFSGVTKVFEQSYPDKSSIKSGLHDFGESLHVSPQPDQPTIP